MRRLLCFLTCLAPVLVVTLISAHPAFASHQFLWWDETGDVTFKTFNSNSPIIIRQGQMEFVNLCEIDGVNDYLWPATDVYIMPSEDIPVGTELEDVSGVPNTIVSSTSFGMFIDEPIGSTAGMEPGEYAVIYDECQDGDVDPGDFVLRRAFQVVESPTDVPRLPLFDELKAKAAEKASATLEDLGEDIDDWFKAKGKIPDTPLGKLLWGRTDIPLSNHPAIVVRIQLINQAKHYLGIAADPPDPDFRRLTPLAAQADMGLPSDDPVLMATGSLATESSAEDTLAEALLHSLERYQGADQAGNGRWALIHARAIRDYSEQLQAQIAENDAALAELDAALAADTTDVDANAVEARAFIERVRASGFTADEIREAHNLGMTDREIDDLAADIAKLDFAGFSEASMRRTIADLQRANVALATEMGNLAADMDTVITTLETDALTPDKAPVADAGGLYTGDEGMTISFSGSATSPSAITGYEWDLDGDGAFDDATGTSPSHTYSTPLSRLVGLKVRNSDNLSNIAYARVEIQDVNRRPVIASTTPVGDTAVVDAGASQTFRVVASDLDGDNFNIEWFVDDTSFGNGVSFTYGPASGDVGVHTVEARVKDSSPLGGEVRRSWTVAVLVPDVDGDGWRTNSDCDDSDSEVNPGQSEVLGNGKDDDCDDGTPETGVPPSAKFEVTPAVAVVGEPVAFADGSTDPDSSIVKWEWDFGDGGTSTAQNPTHTYAASGPYTMKLTVTDEHGNTDSAARTIKVTRAPMADFSVSPAKPVVDVRAEFTDASGDLDGSIAAWEWNFGDGATSTEQSPSHTYAQGGTYTVELSVTDDSGARHSVSREVTVIVPPRAFFNPEPALADGIRGRNVALLEGGASVHSYSSQFSTSTSAQTLIDYSPSNLYWSTGSGRIANQWVKIELADGKTHLIDRIQLMPAPGAAKVRDFEIAVSTTTADDSAFTKVLSATAADSNTLQEFVLPEPVLAKYVMYRPLNNRGATCCIQTQQLKVLTGQEGGRTVTFRNLATDADDEIASYHWDFGDGATSAEQSPTHIFPAEPETYTVKLTVTDAEGQSEDYTLTQRVLAPPKVSFTFSPAAPNEAQSVAFADTITDPDGGTVLNARTWNWGDGTTSTVAAATTSHLFNDSKSYTVTLGVVDRQEQTAEAQRTVATANVAPTVSVGNDQSVAWGQNLATANVTLNDGSSADRSSLVCEWDFGDGESTRVTNCSSTNARVPHAYTDPGTYTAMLTVTDKDGGKASDSLVAAVARHDTYVQVYSVRNVSGGRVEVAAKLSDRYDWTPVPGKDIRIAAGTESAMVTTDANGLATATLPRAADVDKVGVDFTGDTHYNGSSTERVIEAPLGDVVFIVDESGSMADDQADIQRNATSIATQLAQKVDFRLGLVGFGAAEKSGAGHIHTP
jgi:PKD repeat protein